ncbi:TetR/AcrR family transcriptional regulator [Jiella mangrovi]|uniref:TetR/AcrR family transcriptional regulator n=1 Tax=Jiella mangrovi TaxID=2821407 RepID=A0ABS4BNM8_9HYPH|nr:TetR/AcrR family transcriptional regulator [Jiella mangrovi]MBP0618295.1 TetR/AcrR family transcriptional regulator [Jiella mangrovi]
MARIKTDIAGVSRGEPVRQRVIDAAERLLREGRADFSMRDLAADAGVSFATPFNHFGSKAAIMQALSERRIDEMTRRFANSPIVPDAASRVLLAVDVAADVMLEEPDVSRAVMSWLGTPSAAPGRVWERSTSLWRLALGDGDGLDAAWREEALDRLPGQLAFAFRGVLSFWTAGELADDAIGPRAREIVQTLLMGFTERLLSKRADI